MTFSVIGFLGYLAVSGLMLVVVGVFFRKGTHRFCSKCKFDLAGLSASNCPECGEDLTSRQATVIGLRRRGLIRVGAILFVLCSLSLGYLFVDSTSLDKHKPIALLDLELRLFGTPREFRVANELARPKRWTKIISNESSVSAAQRLLDRRIRSWHAGMSVSNVYANLLAHNGADKDLAAKLTSDLITAWPTLDPQTKSSYSVHLANMLRTAPPSWDEIQPLFQHIQELVKASNATDTPLDWRLQQEIALIFVHWWEGHPPESRLSDEQITTLLDGYIHTELLVRKQMRSSAIEIPFEANIWLTNPLVGSSEQVSIRAQLDYFKVDGTAITDSPALNGAVSSIVGGTSPFFGHKFGTSGKVWIEGLSPGKHKVELGTRIIATRVIDGMQRVLFDTTTRHSRSIEILEPGIPSVELLEPGVDHVPTQGDLLQYIRVSELGHVPPRPGSSHSPLRLVLAFAKSERVPHSRAVLDMESPEIDAVFRVIATQGGSSWDLGHVYWRRMLRDTNGGTLLWPMAYQGKDGAFAVPDLTRTVLVTLVPDIAEAEATVDQVRIYAGELDLGEFNLVPGTLSAAGGFSTAEPVNLAPVLRDN